jgi:hypothetical protein
VLGRTDAIPSGIRLATNFAGGNIMANDRKNLGGPSQGRKDPPTEDRDNRNAQSRAELTARTTKRGGKAGHGERNGSDKHR